MVLVTKKNTSNDPTGRVGFKSVFGYDIADNRFSHILVQFQYSINALEVTDGSENSGALSQTDGMMQLSTSTEINGHAKAESVSHLRYLPGHEGFGIFTALFQNGGVSGSTQFAGIFNVDNGYYLGFDGVDFSVGFRRSGSDTSTSQADFNIDRLTNIDFTKLQVYKIDFGWLGTAPVTFYIMNEQGNFIPFHQLKLPGTRTNPSILNPVLPICFDLVKTSGATDIIVKTASWHGGIIGDSANVADRHFSTTATKATVTTEAVIVNLQNLTTYQTKTNRVSLEFLKMNLVSEGTKLVTFKVYKNLTITAPTFVDVNTSDSVMEKDILGTVTVSDDNLVDALVLGKVDSQVINLEPISLRLNPGDRITITGQSANAADLALSIVWKEEF